MCGGVFLWLCCVSRSSAALSVVKVQMRSSGGSTSQFISICPSSDVSLTSFMPHFSHLVFFLYSSCFLLFHTLLLFLALIPLFSLLFYYLFLFSYFLSIILFSIIQLFNYFMLILSFLFPSLCSVFFFFFCSLSLSFVPSPFLHQFFSNFLLSCTLYYVVSFISIFALFSFFFISFALSCAISFLFGSFSSCAV